MTNELASTSLYKTSCPVSGHLIQRFSGVSRRLRKLRILGRTTLESQFMQVLRGCYAAGMIHPTRSFRRNAPGATHALRERGDEIGHRRHGFPGRLVVRVKALLQCLD